MFDLYRFLGLKVRFRAVKVRFRAVKVIKQFYLLTFT